MYLRGYLSTRETHVLERSFKYKGNLLVFLNCLYDNSTPASLLLRPLSQPEKKCIKVMVVLKWRNFFLEFISIDRWSCYMYILPQDEDV